MHGPPPSLIRKPQVSRPPHAPKKSSQTRGTDPETPGRGLCPGQDRGPGGRREASGLPLPAPSPLPHVGVTPQTLGSDRADPVQGHQRPDEQFPHGDQPCFRRGSLPYCFIILMGFGPPRLRPGAVFTREGRCWRPRPFLLFFSPSPIPGGAPGRRGASNETEEKPLSVLGRLPPEHPNSDFSRAGPPRRSGRVGAGLLNKPTTSGNFLRWPRCPPPAPSPPPGWVLGADAVTADPGAGREASAAVDAAAGLLSGARGSGGTASVAVRTSLGLKFSSL